MRRRLIGFNIHAPAAETSVISVTENTQLTSSANGKTYSLDAGAIFLTLPTHDGLDTGFSINIESTVSNTYVIVFTDYVGLGAVTFTGDGLTGDGVRLVNSGDTATLTYNGGGAWTATGTGTTTRYVD